MIQLETTQTVPLALGEDGAIRITGSRVTLDTIVHHFSWSSTAEQIAQKFPSLHLSDIYGVIAYYLSHRQAVEEYLTSRRQEAKDLRRTIQASQDSAGIRQRLLACSPKPPE